MSLMQKTFLKIDIMPLLVDLGGSVLHYSTLFAVSQSDSYFLRQQTSLYQQGSQTMS